MTTVARRDRRQAELAERRDSRRTRKKQPAQRSLMMPLTIGAIVIGVVVIAAIALLRQDVPSTESINEPMARTAYNLADGRAIGPANAPVTLEVWSDYQCPFCQRFATTWESALSDKYVAQGKLRIVYRDYAFIGSESDQRGDRGARRRPARQVLAIPRLPVRQPERREQGLVLRRPAPEHRAGHRS